MKEMWVVLVVCLAVVVDGNPARASCMWQAPEHLFTIPADGEVGVPLDARLWLLAGVECYPVVEFEGVELTDFQEEGLSWVSYILPNLDPMTQYTYTVTICSTDRACEDTVKEYQPQTFTTGEELAPSPAPPVLIKMTAEPSELNDEPYEVGTCKHQMISQDCFDVGPARHYYLTVVEAPGTTHYGLLDTKGEPRYLTTWDCPVQAITWTGPFCEDDEDWCPPTGEACFDVVAFNMAGVVTEPVELCWDFGSDVGPGVEDDQPSDVADDSGSPGDLTGPGGLPDTGTEPGRGGGGCTSGASPVKMPIVVLLLFLGACFARRFFWWAR